MPLHAPRHPLHHGEPAPDGEPGQLPVEPDQGPSPTQPLPEGEPPDTPPA